MKRGFTILELLVASLLLGMLVTILTMVFNQSSIAWRTGVAGVADLDEVRQNVAAVREEADSLYVWNDRMHRLLSPWPDDAASAQTLRERAISVGSESGADPEYLSGIVDSTKPSQLATVSVGTGSGGGNVRTYTVNVKSNGPNRRPDDWDDIWSYPDDFDIE